MPKSQIIWMIFIALLAVWFSWFYRFEPDTELFYLDRWTGSVVHADFSLHKVKSISLTDPVKVVPMNSTAGAFDDLIPQEKKP